jgi:Outer membrane protein beta-barrel domain
MLASMPATAGAIGNRAAIFRFSMEQRRSSPRIPVSSTVGTAPAWGRSAPPGRMSGARSAELRPATIGNSINGFLASKAMCKPPLRRGRKTGPSSIPMLRPRLATAPLAPIPAGSLSQTSGSFRLATVRGRLGFASDRWLIYATGGLAVGEARFGFTFTENQGANVALSVSDSVVKAGWTVGADVEAVLGNSWSVKAEYLFIDLGSHSISAANPTGFGPLTVNQSFNIRDNIVRAGHQLSVQHRSGLRQVLISCGDQWAKPPTRSWSHCLVVATCQGSRR